MREAANPAQQAAIAIAKKKKQGVEEESQQDRNARIIAGEIEDAQTQGNQLLVKQKEQELQIKYHCKNQRIWWWRFWFRWRCWWTEQRYKQWRNR